MLAPMLRDWFKTQDRDWLWLGSLAILILWVIDFHFYKSGSMRLFVLFNTDIQSWLYPALIENRPDVYGGMHEIIGRTYGALGHSIISWWLLPWSDSLEGVFRGTFLFSLILRGSTLLVLFMISMRQGSKALFLVLFPLLLFSNHFLLSLQVLQGGVLPHSLGRLAFWVFLFLYLTPPTLNTRLAQALICGVTFFIHPNFAASMLGPWILAEVFVNRQHLRSPRVAIPFLILVLLLLGAAVAMLLKGGLLSSYLMTRTAAPNPTLPTLPIPVDVGHTSYSQLWEILTHQVTAGEVRPIGGMGPWFFQRLFYPLLFVGFFWIRRVQTTVSQSLFDRALLLLCIGLLIRFVQILMAWDGFPVQWSAPLYLAFSNKLSWLTDLLFALLGAITLVHLVPKPKWIAVLAILPMLTLNTVDFLTLPPTVREAALLVEHNKHQIPRGTYLGFKGGRMETEATALSMGLGVLRLTTIADVYCNVRGMECKAFEFKLLEELHNPHTSLEALRIFFVYRDAPILIRWEKDQGPPPWADVAEVIRHFAEVTYYLVRPEDLKQKKAPQA